MKVIILDAGHGGRDPGAIGRPGGKQVRERDAVLAIAIEAEKMLRKKGFTVAMTRRGNEFVALTKRPALVKADVFVSVHVNASGDNRAAGFETLAMQSEEQSWRLAGELQKRVIGSVAHFTGKKKIIHDIRDRGLKSRPDLAVLSTSRRLKMPAALVELGFINHPVEGGLLHPSHPYHADYIWTLANAITSGVCDYFGVPI